MIMKRKYPALQHEHNRSVNQKHGRPSKMDDPKTNRRKKIIIIIIKNKK
jgi:hypothetical protein